MSHSEPKIRIPVDVANPGQFFACCGLLELADRLWPGVEGWFEADLFCLHGTDTLEQLLMKIISCKLLSTFSAYDRDRLEVLERKKRGLKKSKKILPKAEEGERKRLNSLRIFSGFILGDPFHLQIDWWLDELGDGNHLKTWAGQQAVAEIAEAIRHNLKKDVNNDPFNYETVIYRENDGEAIAPLSFDSGRAGNAQDVGYSPDKIGQALTASVWTEFLCLIALQRFALMPSSEGDFRFFTWSIPLPVLIASVVAKGEIPSVISGSGTFRLAARDTGNRYKAFTNTTFFIRTQS